MTFIDRSAGRTEIPMDELLSLARDWDQYDAIDDGPHSMPHFYSAVRFMNWWGSGATFEQVYQIAKTHGIPVARVPPASVLRDLVKAEASHIAKLNVLVAAQDQIRAACQELLDHTGVDWEGNYLNYAQVGRHVMAAWSDGHVQAAACLALAGAEDLMFLVADVDRGKKYTGLTKAARGEPMEFLFDSQVVLAPIQRLFVSYMPESNQSLPETLSRHAVLHRLPLEHLNEGHSIVAIMLLVSLLLQAQQDKIEGDYYAEQDY